MIKLDSPKWNTRPSRKLEAYIIIAQSLNMHKESQHMLSQILKPEASIKFYLENSPVILKIKQNYK